jgi:hypothetical protein
MPAVPAWLCHGQALDADNTQCRAAKGSVLVMAKLDRLPRSLTAYAHTLEEARPNDWPLLPLDAPSTVTRQGEARQVMTAVFAQLERRLISWRSRGALSAARARGVGLGRPPEVSPEAVSLIIDLHRWTATRIAAHVTARPFLPPGAALIGPSTPLAARAGHLLRRGRPRESQGHR